MTVVLGIWARGINNPRGYWTIDGYLPFTRIEPAVAGMGNKLYVLGGAPNNSLDEVNTFYSFDTTTKLTSVLSQSTISKRAGMWAASDGSEFIYFGGGYDYPYNVYDAVWKYSTITGTWTSLAAGPWGYVSGYLARPIQQQALFLNNQIWVYSGNTSVAKYDIATNIWTYHQIYVNVGGSPYSYQVVMAEHANKLLFYNLQDDRRIREYDPLTNSVTTLAKLFPLDGYLGSFGGSADNGMVIAGGSETGGVTSTQTYRYNRPNNAWSISLRTSNIPVMHCGFTVLSNDLYSVGGQIKSSTDGGVTITTSYTAAIQKYTIPS